MAWGAVGWVNNIDPSVPENATAAMGTNKVLKGSKSLVIHD